ncbi:MAG TPA: hypothetical protein VD927_12785 [Chryseosolibacter sp.]|nr:hypothetical protein [Chryseosolibacter sp.]
MKTRIRIWVYGFMIAAMGAFPVLAQKIDEERMKRDVEVAEGVLSTLIKQEISEDRNAFFGLEVRGNYLPGYGVTFKLPSAHGMPYFVHVAPPEAPNPVIFERDGNGFRYSISTDESEEVDEDDDGQDRLKDRSRERRKMNRDSIETAYNEKLIKASKDFILDYGDLISQLAPNEKITVTNRGNNRNVFFNSGKRTHLSVEGTKSDITAFRQGKISRDQAISKLRVVNTESIEEKEPDMELLSSIFNRLYRADLSNTFFTEDNIYYERLKDYGVIYYMQVYSSTQAEGNRLNMPTIDLHDLDQQTRDKKVIELYPQFEKEMKENILEYGRTVRSLKGEEALVFNVTLTKCKGCDIPSNVEFSVKNAVLQDYSTGKIDKNAALSKISIKQGPKQ